MTSSKPEDFAADFAALRDDVTKLTSSFSDYIRKQTATALSPMQPVTRGKRFPIRRARHKMLCPERAGISKRRSSTIPCGGAYRVDCGLVYRHIWRLAKPQMNALISRLISDATAPVEQMSARLFKKAALLLVAIGCLFVCSVFLTIALFIFVSLRS
jgi:hypothetical protein